MEYFIGWIVLSIIVAFVGSGKTIGFFLSLLLSLLFSPIIGLIIVALSKSKQIVALEKEIKMMKGENYKTDVEIFKEHRELKRSVSNNQIESNPSGLLSIEMIRIYIGITVCIIIGLLLYYVNK